MRVRSIGVGVFALALGFALVLLRGEPFVASDQGVFLSVSGRLLDGDRLYSEVFDNKDPLFFFTYAGALFAGGWRGPFLLDGVWFAAAAISMALLVREFRAPRAAVLVALVTYPLALAGGWYLVGLSMLGALAIAPLVPWLWLRGWHAASGALLVAAMLLKLNLAPLLAAPLLGILVVGQPDVSRARASSRALVGAAGALVAAAAVLGIRGELRSYLDTFAYNVHYSSARAHSDTFFGRASEHLRIGTDFFYRSGRWQLPAVLLLLTVFALAAVLAWRQRARAEVLFAAIAGSSLAGAIVVVAFTAYGVEHLQLLAYPATLIATTLVWRADAILGARWGVVAASGVALFAGWSAFKPAGGTEISTLWSERPISPGAIALERARARFAPDARSVDYMVLGSNSEGGHAAFIDDAFDLSCRYFHLYAFSQREQFDETSACAARKRPPFILVTLGFEPYGDFPDWKAFVASSRRLLRTRYELVEEEYPGVQVWKRKAT